MQVRLTAGQLPPNVCLEDLQQFYNQMFSLGRGDLDTTASIAKIIVSSNEPNADQRDYIWIRLNPTTGVYDKTYSYVNGRWVSPHAIAPLSGVRQIFIGSTADLARLDGGEIAAVGEATGAFWEIDTTFSGKFPLGAGTLASGTVVAGSGASTGGHESVTIARANLPNETLDVELDIIGSSAGDPGAPVVGSEFGQNESVSGTGKAVDSTSTDVSGRYKPFGQTEALGDGTGLNIMPPYIGVYFVKRTSRKYHTPQ